jgi:hypothetical protein
MHTHYTRTDISSEYHGAVDADVARLLWRTKVLAGLAVLARRIHASRCPVLAAWTARQEGES